MIKYKTHGSGFGSKAAASVRLLGFFSLIVLFAPVHIVYIILKPNDPFRITLTFHRYLIRLLGFHVRVHGIMATTKPVLFVSNHSSYLDIPVLGMLIPAAFVAKSEVASWPLFGTMAKLQRTVFIERKPSRTRDHKDSLRTRLGKGQNLILFPEGTSSDGLYVLPFRSGLFAAIEDNINGASVTVQPVSIVCTELDGLPITRAWRPYYAWYGDMTLVKHLWNVFKFGRFTVDVTFHPPTSPQAFADRKALAGYCRDVVARGIELCLTGRHIGEGKMKLANGSKSHMTDAAQS